MSMLTFVAPGSSTQSPRESLSVTKDVEVASFLRRISAIDFSLPCTLHAISVPFVIAACALPETNIGGIANANRTAFNISASVTRNDSGNNSRSDDAPGASGISHKLHRVCPLLARRACACCKTRCQAALA